MGKLYDVAVDVYRKECKSNKKIGSSTISKQYNISIHNAKIVRALVNIFHEMGGTFEDAYAKYKQYESKYKSLLRQYNNLAKQKSDNDDILELIDSRISSYLSQIKIPDSTNNIYMNETKNRDNDLDEEDVVILLSDWHIGEVVDPEVVGYLNEYNEEIAAERLETIISKVIELTNLHRNISNIRRIHIACLGDMVSGNNLHDELDKTNSLNIADQVLYTATLLTNIILELSKHFEEIVFYGVPGNHGRTTKKKEFKDPSSSYDYLAYKITEREIYHLKGKLNINIKFYIPKSNFIFIPIQNHNIVFTHGDNIKSWSGIPYYGMLRDYANKQELMLSSYNMPVHYVCIGHFHQPITINRPLGGVIVNGSLKGTDEYSMSKNLISKPSQTFFGVNKKYGRTFLYELYAD